MKKKQKKEKNKHENFQIFKWNILNVKKIPLFFAILSWNFFDLRRMMLKAFFLSFFVRLCLPFQFMNMKILISMSAVQRSKRKAHPTTTFKVP